MKNRKSILGILLNTIFFLLLSTAAWAASPVIFYSDLTAGPNAGGQNNNGVFVTIWGTNFGAAQGSSYVTVGGGKVNNYPTWTNTEITFQLGSSAATGNIVLNTSNGNATGPAFTVQAGNIYFVQPGASTNGTGTYASPFSHLYFAENISNPGDTIYVFAGTIYDEVNGHPGWHSLLIPERGGAQGSPVAYIAYPNASVILKADGKTDLYSNGGASDGDTVQYIFRAYANWITVAKFTLQMTGTSNMSEAIDGNGDGWKVVGNNVTALTYIYGLVETGSNYAQVLGNEIHDSGSGQSFNNEDHSIYWDAGGNPVEIGWNYLHGNENSGWEISCFHQGSSAEPTRVGKIHDNLIIAGSGGTNVKGILLGDVDSGENEQDVWAQNIEVYNNVLVNLGLYEYGGAIQAVSGTGYIYNNTIYGSGTETAGILQFPGGVGPGGGAPVWHVANNIIYGNNPGLYLSDSNGNAPAWANFALLTNNDYYGEGNGPTEDAKALNANPQFVAPALTTSANLQLQSTSPDINTGYNTTSIVTQDLTGLLRSATPSIGAYEYSSSITTPTPVVSITSPTTGSSYTAGSNVTVTTTASENNGAISSIYLYNGSGVLLASSSSSPFSFVDSNMAAGGYSFFAVAKDANGVSTTSSTITITITSSTTPAIPASSTPVVAIASPANGTNYTQGSTFTITTNASETNGTIAQVQYYSGSSLLATSSTSPYTASWTNATTGSFTLTAKATDANGVSTMSSPITITVTTAPAGVAPSITTQPVSVTVIAPAVATFSVTATGTPAPSYKWMESVNGGAFSAISGATSSSYTTVATSTANSGTKFECVVTNASGSVTSNAATLTVNPLLSLPVVAITSPQIGSSYTSGSSIVMTASASETNGTIVQVQFYNGTTLIGTDTSSPYSFTWSNVPAGIYTLTAKATDTRGVSTISGAVIVTVVSNHRR